MRFQAVAVTAMAASSVAYAADVNSANLAAFSSDFENYVTATLLQDPALASEFAALASDPTGLAQLQALATDLPAVVTNAAEESSIIAAVPTEVRGLLTSIVAVESSIAVKDGVISATATGSSDSSAKATSAGAKATTSSSTESSSAAKASSTGSGAKRETIERGLLAGSLMGVVGLMAAL